MAQAAAARAADMRQNGGGLDYSRVHDDDVGEMMDWTIIRSAKSPGPGAYSPDPPLDSRLRGGKFSTGNPKTDVDWAIYAASQKPGPGQYSIKGIADTTPGGRLGQGKAKGS